MTETTDEKALRLVGGVLDGIEDIIARFEWEGDRADKDKMVLKMAASLSLAGVIRNMGWMEFFKAIIASIKVRTQFPDMMVFKDDYDA
jgi:hypothetical protein